MADKTDSLTPSQPGEMNSTGNHASQKPGRKPCANGYKPSPPPKPPHLRNMCRNGERPRKAIRPRSSVFPVNGDGSSMNALADSQMQQAISTLLNGVLMNSHLADDPSVKELLMISVESRSQTMYCAEGLRTRLWHSHQFTRPLLLSRKKK